MCNQINVFHKKICLSEISICHTYLSNLLSWADVQNEVELQSCSTLENSLVS